MKLKSDIDDLKPVIAIVYHNVAGSDLRWIRLQGTYEDQIDDASRRKVSYTVYRSDALLFTLQAAYLAIVQSRNEEGAGDTFEEALIKLVDSAATSDGWIGNRLMISDERTKLCLVMSYDLVLERYRQ